MRSALRAAPALSAVLLPLGVPASLPLYATEGVVERLTVAVLAVLCVRGARAGDAWLVLISALLVMEEVDWLQPWLGYPTPGWLEGLSATSGQANLHNVPGSELLWRWLPLLVISLRARPALVPRLQAVADRLGLPVFHRQAPWIALALAVCTPPLILLRGERVWDEALELAMVLWAGATWRGRVAREPTR